MDSARIEALLHELMAIPSVTAGPCENDAALFIHRWFLGTDYFKSNPHCLELVDTPLEGSPHRLSAVIARVNSGRPTDRTVLFISHFDVVDTQVYGSSRADAYSHSNLSYLLQNRLCGGASDDLKSGGYIFGRGSMDMKCGVAIEMLLLDEFARSPDMFGVNIVAVFVGDEENSSAGMRGVVPHLVRMQECGTRFLCAVNTEPCEPGKPGTKNPVIFTGSIGKLMPAFYVRGAAAHVGNCYHGLSAALIASRLVTIAEGNDALADISEGYACAPWTCLELKILKEGYSVTVPERAAVYFNAFLTSALPQHILPKMRQMAEEAVRKTMNQMESSYTRMSEKGYSGDPFVAQDVLIITYEELLSRVCEKHPGASDEIARTVMGMDIPDSRDACIAATEEMLRVYGHAGPAVVISFLPPYVPPVSDHLDNELCHAALRAARRTVNRAAEFGYTMETEKYFSGICDLSYVSYQSDEESFRCVSRNTPLWGAAYLVPKELARLDMPVLNLGPIGYGAHRIDERLEREYSLSVLPKLTFALIRDLSADDQK